MKKVDVLNCKEFLSDLKLNKFDKEIRTAIVTNSMVANRISKDFNEATKEATSRYTKDIESEVGTLEMLRNKYQSASSEEKIEIEKEIIEKCPNALTEEKRT